MVDIVKPIALQVKEDSNINFSLFRNDNKTCILVA